MRTPEETYSVWNRITYSLRLFSLRNVKGEHENKGEKKKNFNKMAENNCYLLQQSKKDFKV